MWSRWQTLHMWLSGAVSGFLGLWYHRYQVDWKRPPGRPRHTWLCTLGADLQPHNLGLNSAWKYAQDREHWKHLVETATLQLGARAWGWWWWYHRPHIVFWLYNKTSADIWGQLPVALHNLEPNSDLWHSEPKWACLLLLVGQRLHHFPASLCILVFELCARMEQTRNRQKGKTRNVPTMMAV